MRSCHSQTGSILLYLDLHMQHMADSLCIQRHNANAKTLHGDLPQKHAYIETFQRRMTTLCRTHHIVAQFSTCSEYGRQSCWCHFLQTKNIMLRDHLPDIWPKRLHVQIQRPYAKINNFIVDLDSTICSTTCFLLLHGHFHIDRRHFDTCTTMSVVHVAFFCEFAIPFPAHAPH